MTPGVLLYVVGVLVFAWLAVLCAPRTASAVYMAAALVLAATWPVSVPLAAIWLSTKEDDNG